MKNKLMEEVIYILKSIQYEEERVEYHQSNVTSLKEKIFSLVDLISQTEEITNESI